MLNRLLKSLVLTLTIAVGCEGLVYSQDLSGSTEGRAELEKLVEAQAQSSASAADYARRTAAIDGELQELNTQGAAVEIEDLPPADSATRPLAELVDQLEALKSQLAATRAKIEAHAAEVKVRLDRLAKLPGLIQGGKRELAALPQVSAPLTTAADNEREDFQRSTAREQLLKQQIATLQAEFDYYDTGAALFAAQGRSAQLKLANLTKATAAWQKVVDQRRLATKSADARQAEMDVEKFSDDPVAESIAEQISSLAKQHGGVKGLSTKMASASTSLAKLQSNHDRVTKQHAGAVRRVELLEGANLTIDPTTGQLLRRQRQSLSSENQLRDQLRTTLHESAQAQIDLLTLEERQGQIGAEPVSDDPQISELQNSRSEKLKALTDDYRTYIKSLSETETTLRSLAAETKAFSQFVDKRLLWIPSTEPISFAEPKKEADALKEFFGRDPFSFLFRDAASYATLWAIAVLCIGGLVLRRRVFLNRLIELGGDARRRNCTSYVPTAKAFLYTLLLAAPIPALALFIYSRTGQAPTGVADGIRNVAGFFILVMLFWVVVHPQGLMIDHFRVTEQRVAPLRKNFGWLWFIMPALIFFATALPESATASSGGRLFFIALLSVLMFFCIRVLRPSKQLIHWRGKSPNHLARFCFFLGIAAPAALIIGAMSGYFASVQELRLQSLASVALVLVTLFVTAMLYRWILVSRRRLAVQQALQRREVSLAERSAKKKRGKESPITPPYVASPDEVKTEALKVVEVEEQTSRLVRAAAIAFVAFGIWGIWMPTVPALSALDKVTLWDSGSQLTTDGLEKKEEPESLVANPISGVTKRLGRGGGLSSSDGHVSLQDLVASFVTLLLTYVAARNIPGLLELTIFRRLKLQAGSSFAFTTTIRYVIVVTGIVIAFAMIDITWGKVQWIAAAITLGIGFGLQEIFANFVAGLIILFERPIRLGDVVTVGDVSGRISQIRIRATTIRQFNSRELIVPNKEFITGKLVNWTLSDSILRFEIVVGIAYGSDTKTATEILLQVAQENPKVLKTPAPDVLFDDFGDSALVFQLRAHVGDVDDLLPARNEIRYAIDDAFRQAGIEIAFPQTDVHLHNVDKIHD